MSTVHGNVIVPLTVFNALLGVAGAIIFGLTLKNSHQSFADEKSIKTARETQSLMYGFISPSHLVAALYFLTFIVVAIGMPFQTDLLGAVDCEIVHWIIGVIPALSKSLQYVFFIVRLHQMFKDTFLEVPVTQVKRMIALAIYYGVSQIILVNVSRGWLSQRQVATSSGPSYNVCVFSDNNDFNTDGLFAIFNFLIVDVVTMVWVINGLVTRLLKLHQLNVPGADSMILYQVLLSTVSLVSMFIVGFIVSFSSSQMGGPTVLFFDMSLNAVVIFISTELHDANPEIMNKKWHDKAKDTEMASPRKNSEQVWANVMADSPPDSPAYTATNNRVL